MNKTLTNTEIEHYRQNGYLSPISVLTGEEVNLYRQALEAAETFAGKEIFTHEWRHKPHLVMGWADKLVHHPKILDVVEDVIGPDILCWESALFVKPANSDVYISWHQDLTYWGLDDSEILTAWVALSPSTYDSGCVRVMPGTHVGNVVPHRDTFDRNNMLTRGQEIVVKFDQAQAINLELQPGQMSLHHVKLFHCSNQNRSGEQRIGLAIRYMPPCVRQVVGNKDSATLVRGEDRYGYFELENRPNGDFDFAAIPYRKRLFDRRRKVVMRQVE